MKGITGVLASVASTVFNVIMVSVLLTNHIADGNIWGIYVQDGHLLIGDFWAACLVIFFTLSAIASFGVAIWKLIKIKHGLA